MLLGHTKALTGLQATKLAFKVDRDKKGSWLAGGKGHGGRQLLIIAKTLLHTCTLHTCRRGLKIRGQTDTLTVVVIPLLMTTSTAATATLLLQEDAQLMWRLVAPRKGNSTQECKTICDICFGGGTKVDKPERRKIRTSFYCRTIKTKLRCYGPKNIKRIAIKKLRQQVADAKNAIISLVDR